jgi:hypothetical protein
VRHSSPVPGSCLRGLVPPAKQAQVKSYITSAVESGKLWTSAGRSKFKNESLPNAADAAA